jgi:diaminopimelate epimerase
MNYIKADPQGNITAIVTDPSDPKDRIRIASGIMGKDRTVEQVAFVTDPENGSDISIEMAGGEFCGNAALSAAALFFLRKGAKKGTCMVSVSGTNRSIPVSVERTDPEKPTFRGAVSMPLPKKIAPFEFNTDLGRLTLNVVDFGGISHAVTDRAADREFAERNIAAMCFQYGSEAFGLMLFDRETCILDPLVYVPALGSMFWEKTCASGTAAIGACFAPADLKIKEPGGVLGISSGDNYLLLENQVTLYPGLAC